jgi:hypothetical protein
MPTPKTGPRTKSHSRLFISFTSFAFQMFHFVATKCFRLSLRLPYEQLPRTMFPACSRRQAASWTGLSKVPSGSLAALAQPSVH